ncbi:MAG: hypothetical protein A2289_13225 [Deltaproteobacteria bacterium RIFOXYA12_FULL_58_15]|nr:MAG: hypothetical protein A2289_13225 [Deltaproteobacteria bacterium RIFOXYA12_FULL_58_15]OGR13815.1 MAG: hypothetical protein A2341_01330 [Deltaproteobacteria bacterium RIFOXYB12_FULL_58_9]
MSSMRIIAIVLLVVGSSVSCVAPLHRQIELTQKELTKRVNEHFPYEKIAGVFSLTLDNAEVILSEGSEEVGVTLDATVRLGPIKIPSGRVGVVGKLSYDAEKGYVLLYEPHINTFELPKVHDEHLENATKIINDVVTNVLPVVPLHKVEGGTRWVLKSVKVEKGSVWVELGL